MYLTQAAVRDCRLSPAKRGTSTKAYKRPSGSSRIASRLTGRNGENPTKPAKMGTFLPPVVGQIVAKVKARQFVDFAKLRRQCGTLAPREREVNFDKFPRSSPGFKPSHPSQPSSCTLDQIRTFCRADGLSTSYRSRNYALRQ